MHVQLRAGSECCPLLHHVLWEPSSINAISLILYMFGFLCAVFNNYWDAYSGMSEICLECFLQFLHSADYTEYLIRFSNHHAGGFGNTVKKMWGEMERDRRRETAFDQQEHSPTLWQPRLALLKHTLSPSPPVVLTILEFAFYSQAALYILLYSMQTVLHTPALFCLPWVEMLEAAQSFQNSCPYLAKRADLDPSSFGFCKWHHILWVWVEGSVAGLAWRAITHPWSAVCQDTPFAIRLSLGCHPLMMSCRIWAALSGVTVHWEVSVGDGSSSFNWSPQRSRDQSSQCRTALLHPDCEYYLYEFSDQIWSQSTGLGRISGAAEVLKWFDWLDLIVLLFCTFSHSSVCWGKCGVMTWGQCQLLGPPGTGGN